MSLVEQEFFLPADKKEQALLVLKYLPKGLEVARQLAAAPTQEERDRILGCWELGNDAAKDNPEIFGYEEVFASKTLEEALDGWRYEVILDECECITSVVFTGEKLGDDHILWQALAPFIHDDSYLEFLGEDGSMWRYCFKGGVMRESYADISWPDPFEENK